MDLENHKQYFGVISSINKKLLNYLTFIQNFGNNIVLVKLHQNNPPGDSIIM